MTEKVARHELKFYISRSDYEYARSILSELMDLDENQDSKSEGYFIRSLYFDDAADSAVDEKLDGVENRSKYRLRIYDPNQNWAKFERKQKKNNFINKDSVIVTKDEATKIMEGKYEDLLSKKDENSKSLYFDLIKKYFRPVVVVDYMRDAYKLDYNNIRITFDKSIRVSTENFNIFDESIETFQLQREDAIIMEVKFNTCLPSWFQNFLHFESATNLAISKYCYGRMNTREYFFAD